MITDYDWAISVLGVPPNATQAEVNEAYRDLVSVWHPDKHMANDRLRTKAEQKLKELNLAREILYFHFNTSRSRADANTVEEGTSAAGSDEPPTGKSTHEPSNQPVSWWRTRKFKLVCIAGVILVAVSIIAGTAMGILLATRHPDASTGESKTPGAINRSQEEDVTKLTTEQRENLAAEGRFEEPKNDEKPPDTTAN